MQVYAGLDGCTGEMDFELRTIINVPRDSDGDKVEYAFSTKRPTLVTASGTTVTVQNTSNDAISSRLRTAAAVQRVVHVGASNAFLFFLADGTIASYVQRPHGLELVGTAAHDGEREVACAQGSAMGGIAAFAKADSPSVWCAQLDEQGGIREVFKLRSDVEGGQESGVGVLAKMRGKVARQFNIVAVAVHHSAPIIAAAYENGIARVWDAKRKQQRTHFDAQLLIAEKITGMALHPSGDVLVLCTSQGRMISFRLQNAAYKRGAEPTLATSKMREKSRSFVNCTFVGRHPAYVSVLTRTRRLLLRRVNENGVVLRSSRHATASRPLHVTQGAIPADAVAASRKVQKAMDKDGSRVTMKYDASFGFLAFTYEAAGPIYVYQRRVDRMPFVARPVSCGIDSRFSEAIALKKPLYVAADALFVQNGAMFSYTLGKEVTTRLCSLPDGDVRYIRVARDEFGFAIAALVFMYIDEEIDSVSERPDASSFAKYVLCTKISGDVEWTVSEPNDGRSGCFLNAEGQHDQVLIIANTGHAASLYSFAPKKNRTSTVSRGVRRVRLGADRAEAVFPSPFCSWMAVVYYDALKKRVAVSRNTFRRCSSRTSAEERLNIAESDNGYAMEPETDLKLRAKEVVLDIRWQNRWGGRDGSGWFGAILTNLGVYLVQDVLSPISRLDFVTLERSIVNFSLPTMLWMGPSVSILFGSALYSVSLDGHADLIAGLSHGDNAAIQLAALPDRVVYAKPTGFSGVVSVASRPYSVMSILIRSALAVPWNNGPDGAVDEISELLRTKDASQGSEELIETLIRNKLMPIAYLVCVSEQGRHIVPPLKRSSFLARIGDIRGALDVVEKEYASLPDSKAFHAGTELHRLTQKIMNMAVVCGDFVVAKRCSALLGRRGTFEAFVESEGGYPALRTIMDFANRTGNKGITNVLRPLAVKSEQSCIASDASRFPSAKEMRNTRRAIEHLDVRAVALGTEDKVKVAVKNSEGDAVLDRMGVFEAMDRLQVLADGEVVKLKSSDDAEVSAPVADNAAISGAQRAITAPENGDVALPSVTETASVGLVGGIPAKVNVVYNDPNAPEKKKGGKSSDEDYRVQAANYLRSGMSKVDSTDYDDALEDFEAGIKALGKYVKRLGVPTEQVPNALEGGTRIGLGKLVGYRMAMKLWMAMEEIRGSEHATTAGGKMTIAQLATAMAFVHGFDQRHAIGALNLACDANMEVGNYGTAARCLVQIRQLAKRDEVSEGVKQTLRAKYARCQQFGLRDGNVGFVWTLCWDSLRALQPGERILFCTVCPARFTLAGELRAGNSCTCCRIGVLMVQ